MTISLRYSVETEIFVRRYAIFATHLKFHLTKIDPYLCHILLGFELAFHNNIMIIIHYHVIHFLSFKKMDIIFLLYLFGIQIGKWNFI